MIIEQPRKKLGGILTYVTSQKTRRHDGGVYVHVASGRVIDAIAKHFDRVYLCAPAMDGPPPGATDPRLEAPNVELIPQPFYRTSLGALRCVVGIVRAYAGACRRADVVCVRGMCPYIGLLYVLAYLRRCRVCHWIVGDAVALLRTHHRAGRLMSALCLLYAMQDRVLSRIGRWLTNGAFVCNGRELARAYHSPRTIATVSSTVREADFFYRDDTCQGQKVRILFLGYIRPEKGVQYLLEAVARLKTTRPWELVLVGPSDQYSEYRRKLDEVIETTGIADRLCWKGYVSYGEPLLRCIREADLLVLPTLSEGTPHVLVEAASNSLPIVATAVGGIPTMITDGENGLLVPPKDLEALAAAIDRVIDDRELRRRLIRNGLAWAGQVTVDRFADVLAGAMVAGCEG